MDGGVSADLPLDLVKFWISSSSNSYEAFVCRGGKTEKVASGLLEELKLHLQGAKILQSDGSVDNFILQLPENLRGSSWFTKSTVLRFLHIVNETELLKAASAIEGEMSQLEEARRFHLSLYTQGLRNHSQTGATDNSSLEDKVSPKPEVQTASSDPTKNELLRAMDLRLSVLRGELASSFNRTTGATCSIKQVADLAAFAQHFEAEDIRKFLLKYLTLSKENEASSPPNEQLVLHNSTCDNRRVTETTTDTGLSGSTAKASRNGVSPAKIAQAERQSSTESDESSSISSDEDKSTAERSRPLIRSASPRRSASPMRRVQIGRSGSRRAQALTIKSLSYIPAREKVQFNRDAAGNSSEDEEAEQQPKKSESNVRRMSVQDAINLFESKQRDQKTDILKWRSSNETSVATNKSVLRRWSAGPVGMGKTSTECSQENSSECGFQGQSDNNSVTEPVQENPVEAKQDSDLLTGNLEPPMSADAERFSPEEEKPSSTMDSSENLAGAKAAEVNDRAAASAQWNQQKEAELNQMLLKMLESKPSRYQNTTTGSTGKEEFPGERKGGFYDHYKEKRDAKIRGENAVKRAEKEAQFRALQKTLDQRKAEMALKSKSTGLSKKKDSPHHPQRVRRTPSPSMPCKKDPSNLAASRKASPKASPLPATRSSWPSTPSPRSMSQPSPKISSGASSSVTMPKRLKPQPTPSPTRSSTRLEKPEQQQKEMKGVQTERKKILKNQVEKKPQTVGKSIKNTKAKSMAVPVDDSATTPAKPSLYSKVTKKNSVVPVESKPFLRKGTGIGPGVGPVVVKSKTSQSDESLSSSGNLVHSQENDASASTKEVTNQPLVDEQTTPENDDATLQVQVDDSQKCENTENIESSEQLDGKPRDIPSKTTEFQEEIQADEDSGISPVAWVEMEQEELPPSIESGRSQIAVAADIAPMAVSSPRVRHSLSQMLQADSGEPDIIEWGNAENPPAMIYQKDSPKGFKRLLKFARKSKGEANVTGWASPSVFSEGEEDADEFKAAGKRNLDSFTRKATLQVKGFGQQKTVFSESFNGGNPTKGSMSFTANHELPSAQQNGSAFSTHVSNKLSEGQTSTGAIPTKATRSFFSLSTFRSSKSSETKLR